METLRLIFILVTVALLLASTSGDVLVQPGYGQPAEIQSAKNSADQSGSSSLKNQQPIVNSQQNYKQSQNSILDSLRQQHILQQQYLQQRHQQEHNQLLQLQKQQLQNPAQQQYAGNQIAGDQVLGTPWGLASLLGPLPNHGKYFSLGPMGLHSIGYGNGFGGLLGMSNPYGSAYMQTGSPQYADGTTQIRSKRDVGVSKESNGKKFRQKNSRTQHDDVAANPTVTPSAKSEDSTAPETQPIKRNGDTGIYDNENVGSAAGLLDPLGLLDKTEGLIDSLKSGNLPGPMNMFGHGLGALPGGHPSFRSQEHSGYPQIKEHIVSQSHQNPTDYDPTNQQIQDTYTGDSRFQLPTSMINRFVPIIPGANYGPSYGYGSMYPPIYSPYRPHYRSSMPAGPQGTGYQGYRVIGYPRSNENSHNLFNSMVGSTNPETTSAGQLNPIYGQSDAMAQGKDASGYPTNEDPLSGGNPTGYYDQANNLEPLTGGPAVSSVWDGGQIPLKPEGGGGGADGKGEGDAMIGNPKITSFYDPYNQRNNYDGQKHGGYDLDNIYDYGYGNHHHHHGGYDRIYGSNIYDNHHGYGGGLYPIHGHHHQSYIL